MLNQDYHLILTDYLEIIIIELPKVIKAYQQTPNDELLQWMLFIDNPEKEEVAHIMEKNEDIKEAKKELDRISQDDLLRRRALSRTLEIADRLQFQEEAEAKGLKKGMEKGIKEGEYKKTKEIVKELHLINMTVKQIAQIVKLDESSVEKILNEDNK